MKFIFPEPVEKNRKSVVTTSLYKEKIEKIKLIAREKDMSVSAITRILLEAALDEYFKN